jgi:hypothetical protein
MQIRNITNIYVRALNYALKQMDFTFFISDYQERTTIDIRLNGSSTTYSVVDRDPLAAAFELANSIAASFTAENRSTFLSTLDLLLDDPLSTIRGDLEAVSLSLPARQYLEAIAPSPIVPAAQALARIELGKHTAEDILLIRAALESADII